MLTQYKVIFSEISLQYTPSAHLVQHSFPALCLADSLQYSPSTHLVFTQYTPNAHPVHT